MVDAGLLEMTPGSGRFPNVQSHIDSPSKKWCPLTCRLMVDVYLWELHILIHFVPYFGANAACRGHYQVKETRMVSLLAGC